MTKKTRRHRTASLVHERHYRKMGYRIIAGIDEAGRGPWAGPVAAAAVALPLERSKLATALAGVRDSKTLTPSQRHSLAQRIQTLALACGIGYSSAAEIDAHGIVPATQSAIHRALHRAFADRPLEPDCLFLDYLLLPERPHIPQVSLVNGDKRSLSIACASVIAKVWRDEFMQALDAELPQYSFARHKGYGTDAHRRALQQHGPSQHHRRSFKPVQLSLQQPAAALTEPR